MESTSQFSVPYDEIFYNEGIDEFTTWKETHFVPDLLTTLEKFVADRVDNRGSAEYVEFKEGAYNLVFRFHFKTGGDVTLRVPKPGHSAAAVVAEKVRSEVNWLKFLEEMTGIPVPHVHSFGTHASELLPRLELPFIIMDFLPGENLRQFLRGLSAPGTVVADDEKRGKIYEQIASFYLQLYNLRFDAIGSISKDTTSGRWVTTGRPLTMDMHQLMLGVPKFPMDEWPDSPFENSTRYFRFVVTQQQRQLWVLRNLNVPREYDKSVVSMVQRQHGSDIDFEEAANIARKRFLARRGFEKLVVHYCSVDSDDNFVPFNADFDPRNMLVDPETCEITGLIDVEFTNAMPAAFACDPPLWLLGVTPGKCLECDYFTWFQDEYKPVLDSFLAAMNRVEKREGLNRKEKQLSSRMLKSWESGWVWFNFAANNIDQIDAIYWAVLHDMHLENVGVLELLPEEKTDMEEYVKHTKKKIEEYEEEKKARIL